jgi:hypothetical protein
MNKNINKFRGTSIALAMATLFSASSALAYSVNVFGIAASGTGLHSAVAGAVETNFESGLPANYTGGKVVQGSVSGHWASPPNDTSHYFTVGSENSQKSPGTISFDSLTKYFGYFGGSPDTYNSVELWRDGSLLQSFSGSYLASKANLAANGNWASGAYWNIWATNANEYFDQVKLVSTNNAFETDNHASVSAVPLPAALPLMLSGLGVLGFASRRRNNTAA